ncbi:hypothetical protein HYC85_004596 [Camellia sinensis]|uniref:CTLH domain-containing protein n=1 Tax=Camellia sinensis TaxID=4442 RepID=A0A7J7HYP5_CAMSI|nr:hypothetical protein HYC85_004596 [Camellia sinensis]
MRQWIYGSRGLEGLFQEAEGEVLEQEFGFFFNMRHFEDMVRNGDWDELEKYLSGFTKVDDNRYSMKIFFEIQKQNSFASYFGLKRDCAKAVDVLVKDLKVFSTFNEDLFKEITQLLTLENFRLKFFFQPAQATLPTSIAGWMTNPSPVPHASASAGPIGFITANNASTSSILKRPRTPTNNAAVDYQTADSEHVLKRSRPFGMPDEVNNLPVNILPVGYNAQSHGQSSYSSDDLPKPVVMTLNQGSAVKSMDFHPVQQILLLVGINTGEIMVWDLSSRERLAVRNFKASLANDYTASINRVILSPDGVAYSKNIVHIYSYHGGNDVRNHLEVWDAVTGNKQYSFEGHEAPVYFVCPHRKENIRVPYHAIYSAISDSDI